ncbi:6070_t:CDS:2, partial [Paraglomus occultum]
MAAPNNIIEDFRLCHGFLFDKNSLRLAHKCVVQANSWSGEKSLKKRPSVQLINTHRIQDTYIYRNNLTLDNEGTLFNPPKPFSRYKENNPLYDKTPDEAVIFRLDKELWNINLKDVKPTDEFVAAIKQAIEHNPTHTKLDDVFSEYGYWLNCKIKVGCRLQRFSQFYPFEPGQDHHPKGVDVESYQTEWIDGGNILYDEIRDEWSKKIHPFESDYLLSADNSVIEIGEISEWLEYSPRTSSQWSIIERADFVPTYKLLDEALIAKVEMLFSDKIEVLMTGESPIDYQCTDLCQVNFEQPLLSNAYTVKGKVYNNGKRCDVAVRLYYASTYGFSFEITWNESPEEAEGIYVKWKLSGNRARIGYFGQLKVETFENQMLNRKSYIEVDVPHHSQSDENSAK